MTDFAAEHWAKIYKAEGRPTPSERAYEDDAGEDIASYPPPPQGDRVIMGEAPVVNRVTPATAAAKAVKILEDREDKYETSKQLVPRKTAALWSAYLGIEITVADASMLMALHKFARQRIDPDDPDHYDDGIGYISMAWHGACTT